MKVLYLGLTPPPSTEDRAIVHYPVIRIIPVSPESSEIKQALASLPDYTHLLLTSKNAVILLCEAMKIHGHPIEQLRDKHVVAVGRATATLSRELGISVTTVASSETAEGVIATLETQGLDGMHAFWPRAARARSVIRDYFVNRQTLLTDCIFYHTELIQPSTPPDLTEFEEIVFTSPSTVDGFLAIYGGLPSNKILTAQGPITAAAIQTRSS